MKVFVLLVLLLCAGCYKTVGPVVTSVHLDGGKLRYTRCDLVVGRALGNIGDDSLERCVDENGRAVSPDNRWKTVSGRTP